jgi:hypothetical protein
MNFLAASPVVWPICSWLELRKADGASPAIVEL